MTDKEPKTIIAAMRTCRFFESLDEETLHLLRPTARRIHQPRNTVIFEEGEVCPGLYIVESGVVKIYKESFEAKEHVLHIALPGDPFGEAALFLGTGYPASAAAVQNTNLILLRRDEFMKLLTERPNVSLQLMASMATWAHRLVSSIESLTLKDASARFAAFLLSRAGDNVADLVTVELGMPKQTLASHLGMTGETLSRLLAKFEAEGLILSRGKQVVLQSIDNLRELADYGTI
ncbi:MAG: Crp/Fnr family transcriptional regulator [Armatimonadetes bacterium]|nr:Crp/Fnr family transcriptional regulator [Armatimonadota bacterium]